MEKRHLTSEAEARSGHPISEFVSIRSSEKMRLNSVRHNACNLCVIRGIMDGTLLWGRKAHVLKVNTNRILKARERWGKRIKFHRYTKRYAGPSYLSE